MRLIENCIWEWAETTPDAIAIIDGERRISYRELAERADALSRRLVAAGAGPEVRVALSCGRSAGMLIGLAAILRAGAAYVPVDPAYPKERRAFLLADSQCGLVVTESRFVAEFEYHAGPLLVLDDERLDRAGTAPMSEPPVSGDDPLAYIIYTSGSTGTPKGVQISHHNVLRLFTETEPWFQFNQSDVWSLFHSYAFDFSVWEIWGAFLYGGCLVVVPYETTRDPIAFRDLIRREGVTVLNQTPSAFRMLLRADALLEPAGADALRLVVFGGEALDPRILRPWFARHGDRCPRMVNMYGITETTVHVTYRELTAADAESPRSLIGIPIPDLSLHVLDQEGQPVEAGREGELWVGGAGLSRGYWGRPDLTAERFQPNWLAPAEPSSRLYRTGDLARLGMDGQLEYLGRIDDQVQLRGFRVELGEVEASLRTAPGVSDAVVIVGEDANGETILVGYVVPEAGAALDLTGIGKHVARLLPEYMRPASLIGLEQLPLTPHGKLDRAALPKPQFAIGPAVASAGEGIVGRISAIFSEVLGTAEIQEHSHFFELGGTSLQAMLVALRIAESFGVRLPPGSVFRFPVVAELALQVERATAAVVAAPDAALQDEQDWFPLSVSQQQIWLVQMLHPDSTAFHCPAVFRISGTLDSDRLQAAVGNACLRHPALRTIFAVQSGKLVQQVQSEPTFRLQQDHGTELTAWLNDVVAQKLDLARSCGAARLLRIAPDEHVFALVLHHLVTDGWSLAKLLEEIARDYSHGETIPAPKARLADLTATHTKRLAGNELEDSRAYWMREFADAPTVSALPAENPRPATSLFRSGRVAFSINHNLAARLTGLAQSLRCTANTVLLSGLAALMYRYGGQQDLVLGVPYAGRDEVGSADVQGLFMNLLALRFRPSAGMPFADLVRETQAHSEAAMTHAGFPFSHLVQGLKIERENKRQPLVQVLFAPQTSGRGTLPLPGLTVEPIPADAGETYYDLTLCAWPEEQGFGLELVYAADLFSRDAMESFREHYVRLLESAVAQPEAPVGQLEILSAAERTRLEWEWSGRLALSQSEPEPFLALFAQHVAAQPMADAILYGQDRVSYGELDQWSNRIAHALLGKGVKTGSLVAIGCERSPAAMAAVLGVWKAGAAYVPVDPAYPQERREWMLTDSSAVLLLVTGESAGLGSAGSIPELRVDSDLSEYETTAPGRAVEPNTLAYVIYTSGSTGRPKGVMVEQRGVATLMAALLKRIPLTPGARVLQYTSLSFDVSVGDVLCTFGQGAAMVIPQQRHFLAGQELLNALENERITQALVPMSVLAQLEPRPLPHLIRLVSGGERCPSALAHRWAGGREFINAYGPTEASVGASMHVCRPDEGDPPIGIPLPGWTLYVLDEAGRLLPSGLPGELYIGGNGLASGYLGRPELTKEAFLDGVPEIPERLYRTGDRVRWRSDGALEFIGRVDGQHKLRGFRIELGEVEEALRSHPAVQAGAAAISGEGPAAKLIACVVLCEEGAAAPSHVRVADLLTHLRARLPAQLVPSEVAIVGALPLTPNGKVDRNALPRMVKSQAQPAVGTAKAAGRNTVAAAWAEVLGGEVAQSTNFFDAGGTSLQLVALQSLLAERTGQHIPLAELFSRPTIEAMGQLFATDAADAVHTPAARASAGDRIAIVGMSARFPKAPDLAAFWRNLREGVEGITRFSAAELRAAGVSENSLQDPAYVPARGVIADYDKFDAALFEMGAHEAVRTDPQQRIWLECALASLEDAGCNPRTFTGSIGVFAGTGAPDYLLQWQSAHPNSRDADYQLGLGNEKDFAATRLSYKLGLRGPSLTIQTACSTSLVAVCIACQQLLSGECDLAIAGGASLSIPSIAGYLYREGMILSPDGHCRPFDKRAQGTVPGDGVGAVVLKRLSDAEADGDDIYAVIAGSAVNNDGDAKVGYTAPSAVGQRNVISRAHAQAGITARDLTLVEAHGTGTPLGDPIEFAALRQVFEAAGAARSACALGSVKSSLGHLNTAAGVASLIKVVLAIRHREIPGTLHFQEANPHLELAQSPFFVNREAIPWVADGLRMAGVSSFGVGGTNAHLVVCESPARLTQQPSVSGLEILPVSAATPAALVNSSANLAASLEASDVSLASAAYTLQTGRVVRRERGFVVASEKPQAVLRLRTSLRQAGRRPGKIGFLFPGQGAQFRAMAMALADAEPQVMRQLAETDAVLRAETGLALLDTLRQGASLDETVQSQPVLFAVEYALARALMECGVVPDAMLGHSLGEYVAACLAGVFSLPQALALVAERGRLMQATEPGEMLSVPLSEPETRTLLNGKLDIAAINGPRQCVVSGEAAAIQQLVDTLAAQGLEGRRLRATRAFHSHLMDPMLEPFRQTLSRVRLQTPAMPFLSCVTGEWIRPEQATSAEYWVSQVRQPVRFHQAVGTLLESSSLLLEVGPGETLGTLARRHSGHSEASVVAPVLGRAGASLSEQEHWLTAIGFAWCAGAEISWDALRRRQGVGRAHLPSYPFERKRYWGLPEHERSEQIVAAEPSDWLHVPVWRPAPAVARRPHPARYLVFADDTGVGERLAQQLPGDTVIVSAREAFARTGPLTFEVNPASKADFAAVLRAVGREPGLAVVHAFSLDAECTLADADHALRRSYFSVAALAQALAAEGWTSAPFTVVTAGGQAAAGAPTNPLAAAVAGLMHVVAEEYPDLRCRHIDLDGGKELATVSIGSLLEELTADRDVLSIAIRNGERLIRGYEPAGVEHASAAPALRQQGVYLITGGLGGVGLALAEHLATEYHAHLVLASRSGVLPAGRTPEARLRHEMLARVKSAAASVTIRAVDVSDRQQTSALVQSVVSDLGALDGVIHAAGVTGGGALQRRPEADAWSILRSKVHGTLALDEALKAAAPRSFLFLCSSLTALRGTFGQADYTAANAFLDAFAEQANSRERRVVSVNWDGWSDVGSFARHAAGEVTAAAGALLDSWDAEQSAYRTELPADRWFVAEHRVAGKSMIPGTVYLELACEAALARGLSYPFKLRELMLLTPCVPEPDAHDALYTSVLGTSPDLEIRVQSRDRRGRWVVHAIARLTATAETPPVVAPELLQRAQRPAGRHRRPERDFLELGPRWDCLEWRRTDGAQHLGAFALGEEYAPESDGFVLHPALFDTLSSVVELSDSGAYLPFSYSGVTIFAPLRERVLVFGSEKQSAEGRHIEMRVTDAEGRMKVVVEDYALRRAMLAAEAK